MKKTIYFLSFLIVGLFFISCSDSMPFDPDSQSEKNLPEYNKLISELGPDNKFETRVKELASVNCDSNTIIFTGSSTIAKWETLETDMYPLVVVNRGLGGSALSHIIIYSEQLIFKSDPKKVVLYTGDNDPAWYNIKAFKDILSTFITNFQYRLPESKLYLISVKPSPVRSSNFDYYTQINDYYREFSQNKNIYFIDIWNEMFNNDMEQFFTSDMLHLNEIGYQVLSNKVRAVIFDQTE